MMFNLSNFLDLFLLHMDISHKKITYKIQEISIFSNCALHSWKCILVVIAQADADFIMLNILPKLSEKGTIRETRETAIINFLQDFLQEIESAGM